MIDLRSDTVTLPTAAMRRAMAEAEVGDDVWGEDPTVNSLEERAAELLGKEAGLFVASGTMANLVAQMAHLARGQEIIAGADTHLVNDEAAGHAVVVGASVRQLRDRADGTLALDEIEEAFRNPTDIHEPPTGLIVLENAHSHSMNQPLPPSYLAAVAAIARRHGVPLHVDGARFFNASVALGVSPARAGRAGGLGRVLPLEGPRLPGRVARRRRPGVRRPRPARTEAARRRDAPGGHRGRGRAHCPRRRSGRHDRPPRPRITQRAAAGGGDGRRCPASSARAASPSPATGRLDPSGSGRTSSCSGSTRDRRAFLEALRAGNVLMDEYPHGQIRAVTHHDVAAIGHRGHDLGRRLRARVDDPAICHGSRRRWARSRASDATSTRGGRATKEEPVPDRLEDVVLSRPTPAPPRARSTSRLYDLVEARFRRIIRDNPIVGTYVGIHTEDDRLGDGSRDAVLGELAAEKAHLAAIEAIEPAGPVRRRAGSSAIWRSTTSVARSSTRRSSGPGSAARTALDIDRRRACS